MAKTLPDLRIVASQIKEATLHGENTADRVGGLLVDLVDYLDTLHIDEVTLGPLLTALNNSNLIDPSDGQTLTFSVIEDNWTFSSAITQLKIAQGRIEMNVASNYQYLLDTKTLLQGELDEADQRIRDNYAEYATWRDQTDTYIAQYATAYDDEGNLVAMSTIMQTADEVKMEVKDLETKITNIADPESWEQGTTSEEAAGKTYDETKVDDTKVVRIGNLLPVTQDAYLTFTPTDNNYAVQVLYFNKDKVYCTSATHWKNEWTLLSEINEGKLKIINQTDVQYIAIKLRKGDGSTAITVDDVKNAGLSLATSNIATSSEVKITATEISQTVSDGIAKEYMNNLKSLIHPDSLPNDHGEYVYATWKGQTNDTIRQIAGKWDSEGNLIGYSTTEQTWDHISSEVADGVALSKGYTNDLKAMINTDVLKDASGNYAYATFKQQTNDSISSIAGKWDDEGNLIGYSTTTQTATAISSYVTNTCYNKNQIDSKTTALTEAIAGVKITADSAALTAKAVENRRQNITDIEGWELGNIKNSSVENQDYDDLKEDSSQYVRTKSLFPFTSGNALFIKPESNYSVKFVLFNKDKKSIGNFPYSDVSTNKNGKITITSTDGLAYIAVGLKKNGSSTMALNDVLATDISIVEEKTVTSAEISTFISKTDDGKIQSGIQMNADMINQVAKQINIATQSLSIKANQISFTGDDTFEWEVKVGENTIFHLDHLGNLSIAGKLNQCELMDTLVVGESNRYFRVMPSSESDNRAAIRGFEGEDRAISIGWEYDTYNLPTIELQNVVTWAGRSKLNPQGLVVYTDNKSISLGFDQDGSVFLQASSYNGNTSAWPTTAGSHKGKVYVDGNGFLKVNM